MKSGKTKNLFKKINTWFRNLMLDDVDKKYDGPLPYHRKFGAEKNHSDIKEKRIEPNDWF